MKKMRIVMVLAQLMIVMIIIPELGPIVNDTDCDGVITEEDCDDNDDSLLSKLQDVDCDGVVAEEDCDDNDASTYPVAAYNDSEQRSVQLMVMEMDLVWLLKVKYVLPLRRMIFERVMVGTVSHRGL